MIEVLGGRGLDQGAVNFRRGGIQRLPEKQAGQHRIHQDGAVSVVPIEREQAALAGFLSGDFGGKFLVQQRPSEVVNAHLWEFPNVEITGTKPNAADAFRKLFGMKPQAIQPLRTIKHSITRYRIKLEAFSVSLAKRPVSEKGRWLAPEEFDSVAFSSAHKKLASAAAQSILSGR